MSSACGRSMTKRLSGADRPSTDQRAELFVCSASQGEKARAEREAAQAGGARQSRWRVSQGIEARGARRAGIGDSRVGVARRKADRERDKADFGGAERDAFRRGEDECVDDRAVANGATNIASAERQGGAREGPQNQTATDALS